jgi:hypothetical protein
VKGDEDYWFRAREYGYGAGFPINWKGWALMIAFLVAIFGGQWLIIRFVPQHDWAIAVGLGVVFIGGPLVWLIWRKTEGHWRGSDQDHDDL